MFVSDVQPRGVFHILLCLIRAFTRRNLPDIIIAVSSMLLLFGQLLSAKVYDNCKLPVIILASIH